MALAAEALDVNPDVIPALTKYTWDEESKEGYEKNKDLYPFQKHWLTTSAKDRALSKQEKQDLAHSILFGRRYISIQDEVEATVEQLQELMKKRLSADTAAASINVTYIQVIIHA